MVSYAFVQRFLYRKLKPSRTIRRYHSAPPQTDKLKILFLGRDEFSCLVLNELYKARDVWDELVVATSPDQRVGRRGNLQTISPLKRMAQEFQDTRLEVIPPSKAEFRQWTLPSPFSSENEVAGPPSSHVLVTASFGRILTRKQLSYFLPTRRLNVHPSLLPQYRGPAPIQHALLNGEKETGVCVIEMLPATLKKAAQQDANPKAGIDAGDVWLSKSLPQPEYAKFEDMRDLLGLEGGKLLVKLLRDLKNGSERAPLPQHIQAGVPLRPAPMIRLEDGVFDPASATAEEVYRRWRAIGHQRPISTFVQTSPFAGGVPSKRAVQLDDLHLPSSFESLPNLPGAVVYCHSETSLYVRCGGGGVIAARKIKPQGKPVLDAQAFWNGLQSKNNEIKIVA